MKYVKSSLISLLPTMQPQRGSKNIEIKEDFTFTFDSRSFLQPLWLSKIKNLQGGLSSKMIRSSAITLSGGSKKVLKS